LEILPGDGNTACVYTVECAVGTGCCALGLCRFTRGSGCRIGEHKKVWNVTYDGMGEEN